MPDKESHHETWRVGESITAVNITLLPVEKVLIRSSKGDAGTWVQASKEPFAIIIRDDKGVRALDMCANSVSLEELHQKIPDLDALLAST